MLLVLFALVVYEMESTWFTRFFHASKAEILGEISFYFLLLLANNALGVNLLRQLGEATTANQETIQGVASLAPQLAMGLLIVVVAPLGEEIICRAVIPRLIFKGTKKLVIWLALLSLPIYTHQVILVPGSSMGACPHLDLGCLPLQTSRIFDFIALYHECFCLSDNYSGFFSSRLKYGRMIGPMGFIQKLW